MTLPRIPRKTKKVLVRCIEFKRKMPRKLGRRLRRHYAWVRGAGKKHTGSIVHWLQGRREWEI